MSDRIPRWSPLLCILLLGAVLQALPAGGETTADARIEVLERRIEELETKQDVEVATAGIDWAAWTRHIRLGGSGNTGYYWGSETNVLHDKAFQVWDVRFFVDAELGDDLRIGDFILIRNAGFSFEWDLVRIGILQNAVGDLYGELQGLGGTAWLNLQLGRFQIPVGEAYLRYGKGYGGKPFVANVVGGPWYWDEGLKVYGGDEAGRFGYIASVTTGETAFNSQGSSDNQYTLKLLTDPTPWLHVSVSGLYGGAIGMDSTPGSGGALWLGEAWARTFGNTFGPPPGLPNYVDGVAVPDSPTRIQHSWLVGGDLILERKDRVRLWLGYGYYDIHHDDPVYDRGLHYWVAEVLLYGGLVTPSLSKLYLGLRANGLGTYDDGKGYLLDFRTSSSLGYNASSFDVYSVVFGWKLFRHLTARAEYSYQRTAVVEGVTPDIAAYEGGSHAFAFELGAHF